ncbi:hypothetical protein B566_EDAN008349 [Ephemera danica]|nr:hypothetical protein B566_EDAN008349 [Ephemera danica]
MLPPPPPPPMARPVAIIRSTGELSVATSNSPPTSSTPPMGESSPRDGRGSNSTLSPSPPVSSASSSQGNSQPPSDVPPSSRTVVTSPFSVSREYAFSHIHAQPGQLFTYPSISPAMSGVISPTNLSLFTSPVSNPRSSSRSTPIPRWNTPFISLDEDYMMTPLISGNNPENNAGSLMDDERYFSPVVQSGDGIDAGNSQPQQPSGPSGNSAASSPSRVTSTAATNASNTPAAAAAAAAVAITPQTAAKSSQSS